MCLKTEYSSLGLIIASLPGSPLLLLFHTANDGKLGGAWERGYTRINQSWWERVIWYGALQIVELIPINKQKVDSDDKMGIMITCGL